MSLYIKLAFSNIKNNRRSYFPYILSAILSVAMFYILYMISIDERLHSTLTSLLLLTVIIAMIFSGIFLFYTNSFLFKQRKKEFGLYQVLGMGKNNLSQLIFWESLIVSIVSIVGGLVVGILFSKLIFMILLKFIRFNVDLVFTVRIEALEFTTMLFSIIFALILIWNLFNVRIVNVIDLVLGGRKGEKEPKEEWFIGLFGFTFLGIGYGIAQVVGSPINAIPTFLIAVCLVMIATYLIFIAGNTIILKILKRNKKFYYKTKNFLSLSSLMYRIKQNAVGLANICIMSTGVLVLVSTTISLYAGIQDITKKLYPKDFMISYSGIEQYQKGELQNLDEKLNEIRTITNEEIRKRNLEMYNYVDYISAELWAMLDGNVFTKTRYTNSKDFYGCVFITIDDYNRIQKTNLQLNDDEVLLYIPNEKFNYDEIDFNGKKIKIKQLVNKLELVKDRYVTLYEKACFVVPSIEFIYDLVKDSNESINYYLNFDVKGGSNETIIDAYKSIDKNLSGVFVENKQSQVEYIYSIYGVLLFLGIFIGALLLMATTLVIYYKQISEGLDDKERYQIMQKVGMSTKEIKSTIRRQILIVFFMPLVMSFVHMSFGFKIINKMLFLLNFDNTKLFLLCIFGAAVAFSIFYVIIFSITSREYYKIVK